MMHNSNWGNIIANDTAFWLGKNTYIPQILSVEYQRLRKLFLENQVMGAIFELKDVIELTIKIPVILAMAISLNDDRNKLSITKSKSFELLLSGPLSLGHWMNIAKVLIKEPSLNESMKTILDNTLKYLSVDNEANHSVNIVAWRNKRIGHGAFNEHLNRETCIEVEKILVALKEVFEANSKLFQLFEIYQNSTNLMKRLDLDTNQLEEQIDELLVKIDDKYIPLTPFIIAIKNNIYLYDSFLEGKKVGYLDYINADKIKLVVDQITCIYNDLNHKTNILSLGSVKNLVLEDDEISYLSTNMRDLIKPEYLVNKLKSWIDTYSKGIFRLQMDTGMGKSTFVKMLDPFLNEQIGKKHITFPDVSVRCFYINNTYSAKLSFFRDGIKKSFYKTDDGKVFKGNDISFKSKNEFAEFLNLFLEYYQQLSYSGYNVKPKILLVIDALDESFKNNESEILSVIPDENMLSDDIYILITYRTDNNLDYSVRNEFNIINFTDTFIINSDDKNNQELIKKYILKFAPHMLVSDNKILNSVSGTTFLRANILRYIPSVLEKNTILFDSDIFKCYFNKLYFFYSDKYYEKIKQIIILLSFSEVPLNLEQISTVLGDTLDNFQILCILDDLGGILYKINTHKGVSYTIKHLEIKKFILDYFSYEAELLLITLLNQLIELLNSEEAIDGIAWLRLLLVFKNMKKLNLECFFGRMFTYKFMSAVLMRFSSYNNELLVEYWSEYLPYMYIELGLSIINNYKNNAEEGSLWGTDILVEDDLYWIESFGLSLVAIGIYKSNSEIADIKIINNIIILLSKVSNYRGIDYFKVFKNIFEVDKTLQSYFDKNINKDLSKLDLYIKEPVELPSIINEFGLSNLPISFYNLFYGPRECILSLIDSILEYLKTVDSVTVDNDQVHKVLRLIYFISNNDKYISKNDVRDVSQITYHSFLEFILHAFRPIERWLEPIYEEIPLTAQNTLSQYERACIKRCLDGLVNNNLTGRSPIFGDYSPNVLYVNNDSNDGKLRLCLTYSINIDMLTSYLSELFHVIKSKKLLYESGYYPPMTTWIFATPKSLSLGTNRGPLKVDKKIEDYLLFVNSQVKLSRFDRNWELISGLRTLSSRTTYYLRFLCDPMSSSIYNSNDELSEGRLPYITKYQVKIDEFNLWEKQDLNEMIINRIFVSIIREYKIRFRRHMSYYLKGFDDLVAYLKNCRLCDSHDVSVVTEFISLYRKFISKSADVNYVIQELKIILFDKKLLVLLDRFCGRLGRQINLQSLSEWGLIRKEEIDSLNLDYYTYQEKLDLEHEKYDWSPENF